MAGTGAATVQLDRPGGHTFTIEFKVRNGITDHKAVIRALSFFMPDTFANCEDTKVCLEILGANASGLELRNSNLLQWQCLMSLFDAMSSDQKQTCEAWKVCLSNNDEHHAERILAFLNATGVGAGGPATTPVLLAADPAQQCIDPRTSDPESWDCDCFEEMHRRCEELGASQEFAFGGFGDLCLRAQYCMSDNVCGHWNSKICDDPLIQQLQGLLQDIDGDSESEGDSALFGLQSERHNMTVANENQGVEKRFALVNRQTGGSIGSSKFDDTAQAKRCK
eukprot:gnl/TRDRNA2_/TRDRNA2_171665_c2_seq4.p1 gnl/TRDRNA2_/TRDRNA2_171665_c2~~gnl/TRDRNA2_/TRDRNA2_171665_c2_seq4.p1  ORF type:complete len:280 (-),score=44.26 gnl/TRDRNA2_/TRDRNA2_171665_c2_seq4:255-1094(-)